MRRILPLLILTACGDDPDAKDTAPRDETGGPPTETRATLDGIVTWNVDFDAEAEAAGATDCAYSRHYVGSEDRSAPWLCGACELVFRAAVTLDRGAGDCYGQVTSTEATAEEWLGYGGGEWYRSGGAGMTVRGAAAYDGVQITVEQVADSTSEAGDTLTFNITGDLAIGEEEGDPDHGWSAPDSYACGWPKAAPPAYSGDYTLTVGETLPDGLLADVCEEPVRLHDFKGEYLVVDVSAMDCGPCQSAADGEQAWIEEMADQGVAVRFITVLAPSLSDTAGTPTTAQLEQWLSTHELSSPVLADRVWGLSVVYTAIPDDFGYPAFVLVDPDLQVMSVSTGFGDGTFTDFEAAILADLGR